MNYVIMKHADSYNDEIYELLDSGTPEQVFDDETLANAECEKLQMKALRGCQIGGYAYDLRDLVGGSYSYKTGKTTGGMTEEDVIAALPFCKFPEGDFNEWVIPSKLTDDQMRKVIEVFKTLQFYSVVAVN